MLLVVFIELTSIDTLHGGTSEQAFLSRISLDNSLRSLSCFFAKTKFLLTLSAYTFLDLFELFDQIIEVFEFSL